MGVINVNQVSAQQGIKLQGFANENAYPSNLGTSDAGFASKSNQPQLGPNAS